MFLAVIMKFKLSEKILIPLFMILNIVCVVYVVTTQSCIFDPPILNTTVVFLTIIFSLASVLFLDETRLFKGGSRKRETLVDFIFYLILYSLIQPNQ